MAGQDPSKATRAAESLREAPASEVHAETLIVDSDTHREPAEASAATEALPGASAADSPAASSSPELPSEFGRYRIERLLGRGAMGAVFLAHDTQLHRPVALKVPSFGDQPPAGAVERFLREARAAATLCHPNICPVHDVGEHAGTQFISMGFIDGRPLSEYIASGKAQPERQVAVIVRKLALALHEAHERGIVHRDLKPANIMIDHRNEPIVMDFGLARAIDDDAESRLTREGTIVGTPAYMAPEQLDGTQRLGPTTDMYALGVVLYELLAGKRPFSGSVISVIGQILHAEPPMLEGLRPDVSPALAAICRRAMAKKPAERFDSMNAFADELTGFLKGDAATVVSDSAATSPPLVPPTPTTEGESATNRQRSAMPNADQAKPSKKSRSRPAADWWETEEMLPLAPPPSHSTTRNRRQPASRAASPVMWLAGGAVLGTLVVGVVLLSVLSRGGDSNDSNTPAPPSEETSSVAADAAVRVETPAESPAVSPPSTAPPLPDTGSPAGRPSPPRRAEEPGPRGIRPGPQPGGDDFRRGGPRPRPPGPRRGGDPPPRRAPPRN